MEYDEDLASNPFLKFFQEHYGFLYEEAVKQQWILCIPSVKSLCHDHFDELYVRQHLILQDGDTSRTLANDPVQIKDDWLSFGATSVRILFQETFYTKLGKVRALCIHKEDLTIKGIKSPTILQKKTIRNSIRAVKNILTLHNNPEDFANPDQSSQCLAEIKTYMSTLDSRISSCVIHNLYTQLMNLITVQQSKTDATLNKIRRNNFDINPRDINLPEEFLSVLDNALIELEKLPDKKLVQDKLDCLRKIVNLLSKTDIPAELNADNLLSLLSYLILKSEVTNWTAQLDFIKFFNTSSLLGEDGYLLSTLEAVLDHLKQSGVENQIKLDDVPDLPLFLAARHGDADTLTELLYSAQFKCHPLCSCHACGLPTVVDPLGTDSRGWTALHYACYFGHSDATQVLLKTCFRDNVQTTDHQGRTALHWAAYRGNQTCLLLLCHQSGCDLNARDQQGNSALHLAVLNGHDSCVKALLYYSEQAHLKLKCDAINENGDTALHLASRWGYCNIVKLLLQWEADWKIPNKQKQTAVNVAQNVKVSKMISDFHEVERNNAKQITIGSKIWTGITRQLSLRRRPTQLN